MKVTRRAVEILAAEIHRSGGEQFGIRISHIVGSRQTYWMRPGSTVFHGRDASQSAAAFLLGALEVYLPLEKLSGRARYLRSELFPESGARLVLAEAYELGKRLAKEHIKSTPKGSGK